MGGEVVAVVVVVVVLLSGEYFCENVYTTLACDDTTEGKKWVFRERIDVIDYFDDDISTRQDKRS